MALTVAVKAPLRSETCTTPLTKLPPTAINGKVRLSTIGAAGGAAADGVEVGGGAGADAGVGVAVAAPALGERVGGVMNGTGVGRLDVPVVETHAVSTAPSSSVSTVRVTQIATVRRYAESGMECLTQIGG